MAVFYTGSRPVTKGRNSNDAVHPYKGVAGTYSYWVLYHTSHVLDGAPNTDHDPGDGRHPHGLQMSRWFRGLDTIFPMRNAGEGTRIDGMRYRPLENKATDGAIVFQTDFGRTVAERLALGYTFDDYTHTNRIQQLEDPGHVVRDVDAEGTAATFGRFAPYINKGVSTEPLEDAGQAIPDGYDNDYGHNRVLEWQGVTSARALNV